MSKSTGWAVIIVLIVILGALYYWEQEQTAPQISLPATSDTGTDTDMQQADSPLATAVYNCDNGHTIAAAYYQGAAAPASAAGQPPTPTGSVEVSFDGGPTTTLNQTVSADGARYSDGDPQIPQGQPGAESLVFWSKGDTALVMQNNTMDPDYTNCATQTSS